MRAECNPPPRRRSLWLGALAGALTVILIAGTANSLLLRQLHDRMEINNRGNAETLAASVARTLGRQFERAARLGIPLNALPGIDQSLQRTLDLVPGLARITLYDAEQRILGAAQRESAAMNDVINTPIMAIGTPQGRIEIATAPATLLQAFVQTHYQLIALTLGLGLLGGLAGGLYARRLARCQNRLHALLEAEPGSEAEDTAWPSCTTHDPFAQASLHALAMHAETARLQYAFDIYTQELLAVDFDDHLHPHISALPSAEHTLRLTTEHKTPVHARAAQFSLRTRLTLIVALGFTILISLLLGAQAIREHLLQQRLADTAINDQAALWNEILSVELLSMDAALQRYEDDDPALQRTLGTAPEAASSELTLDALIVADSDRTVRTVRGDLTLDQLLDAGTYDRVRGGHTSAGLRQIVNQQAMLIVARQISIRNRDYMLIAARTLAPALKRYAERSGGTAHFLDLHGTLNRSTDTQLWQTLGLSPSTRQASHQILEHIEHTYTVTTIPVTDMTGGTSGALSSIKDVTSLNAAGRTLEQLTLIATLTLALLGILAIYLMIWRSFRPLQGAINTLQALSDDSRQSPHKAGAHSSDEIESLREAIAAFRHNTSQLALSHALRERTRRRQEAVIARELHTLADAMDATSRDEVLALLEDEDRLAQDTEPLRRLAHVMGELRSRLINQHRHLSTMVIELRDALVSKTKLIELQQELQVARTVQMSILPRVVPADPRMTLHCRIIPAREVGGDFYDYYMLDEHHLGFAIADVSGKGVPAALFMAISRTLLKSIALFVSTPGTCIGRLNELLAAENDQMLFVTLFYGVVDLRDGTLDYVNAGHNPPYLIRQSGMIEHVPPTQGMAVGIAEGIVYRQGRIQLAPGDTLYLYTDGITEAFDADEHVYGEDRLEAVLANQATDSTLEALSDSVIDDVEVFERGVRQTDDITSVSLRYHGPD